MFFFLRVAVLVASFHSIQTLTKTDMILLLLLLLLCVCLCVCTYRYVHEGAHGDQKKMSDPLRLEVQDAGSSPNWVLGSELQS